MRMCEDFLMYNKRSSFIIHQLTGKINMGTEAATHQDLLFDFVRHCLSVYVVKAFRLLTYIKKRTDLLYAPLLSIFKFCLFNDISFESLEILMKAR